MPPTSNMRKTSVANSNSNSGAAADNIHMTKRTSSGRAVRANTTRPANYYARPFGSLSAAAAASAVDNDPQDAAQPGFFPALQYFSDAIVALPKEVMRQFTLMKEVEAKIHGPTEKLLETVDALMELPVPSRKRTLQNHHFHPDARILSLTANNSAVGSASASLINGVAGGQQHSAQGSVAGSVIGEEAPQVDREEELARRRKYHELRLLTHNLLPNLDEKNVVLAEANRVLAQQLLRVDSVMPHVENEISEEARLGSMTHWAYSDNRQKKNAPMPPATRRDVAATNNLAAAAAAMHETDIAQARRDAGREAIREKHGGKGKRQLEPVDSDFDDKPKKTQTKATAKGKIAGAAAAAAMGLGISALGEPVKRRKVDKGLAAPAMERSMSGATKGAKAARETPRSTPAAEPPTKKATKAKAAPAPPKRKLTSSVQNSPAMASSPLHSSFNPATMEPPPSARPQSARLRQNSTATNLRYEKVAEVESRPASAPGAKASANGNGEKNGNGHAKRKVLQEEASLHVDSVEERHAKKSTERGDAAMKREVDAEADAPEHNTNGGNLTGSNPLSRSTSHSHKAPPAPRASKAATPRHNNIIDVLPSSEIIPSMARTISTRSARHSHVHNTTAGSGTGRDSSASSVEPQQVQMSKGSGKHRRHISSSHLVKQLAPFNRSPDIDRHQDGSDEDEDDGDVGSEEKRERKEKRTNGGDGGEEGEEVVVEERRGRRSRPSSRRNTILQGNGGSGGSVSTPSARPSVRELDGAEVEGEGIILAGDVASPEAGGDNNDALPILPTLGAGEKDELAIGDDDGDHDDDQAEGVMDQDLPPSPSPAHMHPDYRHPNSHPTPQADTHPESAPQSPISSHHSPAPSEPLQEPANEPNDLDDPSISSAASSPIPDEEVDEGDPDEGDQDEGDPDEDPDDPNEPKYCYCDRGSYGEMVACDNDACPREWFHLGCTGLRVPPPEEEKWFCRGCRRAVEKRRGKGGGGNGGGRGGGRGVGRG